MPGSYGGPFGSPNPNTLEGYQQRRQADIDRAAKEAEAAATAQRRRNPPEDVLSGGHTWDPYTGSWQASPGRQDTYEGMATSGAVRSGGRLGGGISQSELAAIRQSVGADQPWISRISGPSADQETAARNAAFARAKDKFGSISQSALTGLRDVLARRGMGGGAYEGEGIANLIGRGAGELGEFTRGQAEGEVEQARHVADLEYQGQIQQRGQNQASINALFELIRSRGGLY